MNKRYHKTIRLLASLLVVAVAAILGCRPHDQASAPFDAGSGAEAPRKLGTPSTPYAQVRVSVNGGANQTGGITVSHSDVIQLSATSTVGWTTQKWEIFDYPSGFAVPSGWSTDANGVYFSTAVTPTSFTIPSSTTVWGKWLLRLRINDALTNASAAAKFSDESTAVRVLSPNGVRNIGVGETNQFAQNWGAELKSDIKTLDSIAGGGDGGVGTVCAVNDLSSLRALASSGLTNNESCSVGSPPGNWGYSSTSGAGFTDDGKTVVKPNDLSNGSNGRWYVQTGAPIVATLAALRLAVAGQHASVQVQAANTYGDLGGDIFDYVSTDTTSSDNACTIIVAGTRRYYRRFLGAISVRQCGARADIRSGVHGTTTAGSQTFTCSDCAFTSADVGKTLVAFAPGTPGNATTTNHRIGVYKNTLSGTVAIRNGSRAVVGTGTAFEDQLYLKAPVTVNGTDYNISNTLTGTFSTTATNTALTGSSTQLSDEVWPGATIGLFGGTGTTYYQRLIQTRSSDTAAVLNAGALQSASGLTGTIHLFGDGHDPASSTSGGTLTIGGTGPRASQLRVLLDSAAGATTSGLTMLGPPNPLITTISGYVNPTTVTVAATAANILAGTNLTTYIGTDDEPAFAAAVTAGTEVVVPPGQYMLGQEWRITRQAVHVQVHGGAQLYQTAPITIDAPECAITGSRFGYSFGAGQGVSHDNKATNVWIGPTAGTMVRIGNGASADSSALEYLTLEQVIDQSYDGTGGVTGLRLGHCDPTNGCFGAGGVTLAHLHILSTYNGILMTGGSQQWHMRDNYVLRKDSGNATFSDGIGIGIGADVTYCVGGAATAGEIAGGSIQSFGTAVQFGSVCGDVVTMKLSKTVIENCSPVEWTGVRAVRGSMFKVEDLHVECGSETVTAFTSRAIQVGAPATVAQNVALLENYLTGTNALISGYGWDGMVVEGNFLDGSGNSQDATHLSHGFQNVAGGLRRRGASWMPQVQPSAGSFAGATEIDDSTGFQETHVWNQDSSGFTHAEVHFYNVNGQSAATSGTTFIDNMQGPTKWNTGTFTFGDDALASSSMVGRNAGFDWQAPDFSDVKFRLGQAGFRLQAKDSTPVTTSYVNTFELDSSWWDPTGTPQSRKIEFVIFPDIFSRNPLTATLHFQVHGANAWDVDNVGRFWLGAKASNGPGLLYNAGSPEGVSGMEAPPGSVCFDTTNGEMYVKHSGTGNTGWRLVTHARNDAIEIQPDLRSRYAANDNSRDAEAA